MLLYITLAKHLVLEEDRTEEDNCDDKEHGHRHDVRKDMVGEIDLLHWCENGGKLGRNGVAANLIARELAVGSWQLAVCEPLSAQCSYPKYLLLIAQGDD
jgi:hypothetical protein